MPLRTLSARLLPHAVLVAVGFLVVVGVRTFQRFQPAAITLGPETTIYFRDDPPLGTRVHEAIHRRQMRDKSWAGQVFSALRYNFDYGYRLEEEAEAKAGEICLQIHKFSSELPAYTTARSLSQAKAYRAWAWERIGVSVPDRVGENLANGERCADILRGVELDLPPGVDLPERDRLRLATFHFLQSYGSSDTDLDTWKARLELAGYADPVRYDLPPGVPDFHRVSLAAASAAPTDTTITPVRAGRALHRLTYYHAQTMYTQLQPPIPGYRGRALLDPEEAEDVLGLHPERWPVRLVERGLGGALDEDEAAFLEEMASHPLHADFETFARAPEADIVGTRYRLHGDREWRRLALTDLEPIREAFRAQSGRIALAAARGDLVGAEGLARLKIAGALQMVRNAPFEVDVLEAMAVLGEALAELRLVLQAGGGAPELAWMEEGRGRWLSGSLPALFSDDPATVYHALEPLAGDPAIPHAFRRFAYRQVVLYDVCLALHGDARARRRNAAWRRTVEAGLVRRDSDARVLGMMRENVLELIRRSDVDPSRICAPTGVARPEVRMAIMTAPPQRPALAADREE